MATRLYVGNLAYSTTEESLRAAFEADGRKVANVFVATDRETGRPRGFAFVEMGSPEDAQAAIEAMNGYVLDGRPLRVNEAQDRPPRRSGGFGGPPGERGNGRGFDNDRGGGRSFGGDRGGPPVDRGTWRGAPSGGPGAGVPALVDPGLGGRADDRDRARRRRNFESEERGGRRGRKGGRDDNGGSRYDDDE